MKILKNVKHEELIKRLPKGYAGRLSNASQETKYMVLLFGTERKDVNLSGHVRRGLRKVSLKRGQVLLAVGGAFTAEAKDVLREAGAEMVSLSDFDWTDDSYLSVREARSSSKPLY